MIKKLISVAAATAIVGTGAQAFDMLPAVAGQSAIVAYNGKAANYINGVNTQAPLLKSSIAEFVLDPLKGDALIFPAFNTKGEWGNEFSFRNNLKDHAVVAKVVLYAADDSREILDFNVYMSAKDQVKFTIQNGHVTSTDGSILTDLDNAGAHFADEIPFDVAVVDRVTGLPVEVGYAAVLGMVQAPETFTGAPVGWDATFHMDHAGLYAWYIGLLDAARPNWSTAEITHGTYTDTGKAVEAPDLDANEFMEEVNFSALSGTERMYNATGDKRDMKINGVALANFTAMGLIDGDDGRVMLYAPGETANLVDRNIRNDVYMSAGMGADLFTFLVGKATYTYDAAASVVENKMLVLQPMKRGVVQTSGSTNGWAELFWTTNSCDAAPADGLPYTGKEYGFRAALEIYNEKEVLFKDQVITSPADGGAYCNELVELTYLEEPAVIDFPAEFANKNGFVDVTFLSGAADTIPALISQMTASRVDGSGELNWLYSPANRFLNIAFTAFN